jgi:hypothetical protein
VHTGEIRPMFEFENVQSVSETGFFRSSFTHPSMACQGSFLLQNAVLNAFQAALILKS